MKFGIMTLPRILLPSYLILSMGNYYEISRKKQDLLSCYNEKSVSETGTISTADGNRRERNRNKAGGIYVF